MSDNGFSGEERAAPDGDSGPFVSPLEAMASKDADTDKFFEWEESESELVPVTDEEMREGLRETMAEAREKGWIPKEDPGCQCAVCRSFRSYCAHPPDFDGLRQTLAEAQDMVDQARATDFDWEAFERDRADTDHDELVTDLWVEITANAKLTERNAWLESRYVAAQNQSGAAWRELMRQREYILRLQEQIKSLTRDNDVESTEADAGRPRP